MAYGDISFMIPYALGGISPALAAFIALGKPSARELGKQLFKYRISIGWYAGIVGTPLVINGVAWVINRLVTGSASPFLEKPVYRAFFVLPLMIIGGGLEEIGWRGVLLPELLRKMPAWKATLVVSLVWGIWHLPLWFIPGVAQQGSNFAWFMVNIVSVSTLLTILYLGTRSVFACLIFHALGNAYVSIGLNAWPVTPFSRLISVALSLIIPIIIFYVSRPLARYPPDKTENHSKI